MPELSPQDKGEAEFVASSPQGTKHVKRHIPPPPIMRPGGQYERDDEQVLKGPKVAQLLRIVIKPRDVHKELNDRVAELTLELKSVKDDYDTLHHGLGVKIECLEKCVEKGNHRLHITLHSYLWTHYHIQSLFSCISLQLQCAPIFDISIRMNSPVFKPAEFCFVSMCF
jgi:hypothetical protein